MLSFALSKLKPINQLVTTIMLQPKSPIPNITFLWRKGRKQRHKIGYWPDRSSLSSLRCEGLPFPPRVVDLRTNTSRLDICHNDPQECACKPLAGYAVDIAVGRGFDPCYWHSYPFNFPLFFIRLTCGTLLNFMTSWNHSRKQAVSRSFLRKVLPTKHQQTGTLSSTEQQTSYYDQVATSFSTHDHKVHNTK
jgi:hypothetical protein